MQYDDYNDLSAEPDAVIDLFTTREYFERKYENLGGQDIEVLSCTDDGETFSIKVYLLEPPNKPLPGFMRKIAGDWIATQRRDTWHRSTHEGRLDIRIKSAPVAIGAEMRLEPLKPGTRLHLHFDIRAHLPVMAGRVEKFLAEDLAERVRADMAESERLLPQIVDS